MITIALAFAGWFALVCLAERLTRTRKADKPRRPNGQYKRTIIVREYGKEVGVIYL